MTIFINKFHSYHLYTTIEQLIYLTKLEMYYIITRLLYIYEYTFNIRDVIRELNDESTDIVLYFISVINNFIEHNPQNMNSIYTFIASLMDCF